ncbi:MAG TPA: AI-2E family transporter, partial [Candidatus Limnocylindrales bacterium]
MQSLSAVSLRPALVVSAAAVIVAVGIEHFASLVVLVAFSALIAVLSRRLQLALLRRRLPSWLALTVTLGVIIVLLVVLFGSAVLAMGVVVAHLSADEAKIASGVQDVVHGLEGIVGVASGTLPTLDPAAMLSSAKDLLASITGTITTLAMSVLIVTYLLIDAGRLRGRMLGATSPESVARYDALAGDLVTYIRVRAVLGGAAAICDVVLLLVIGVPNALLWGVMSFLFSFVPNLGFIIALIPPTVIALVELGVWPAVAVVVGYVAINLLFDYVLQPRMMQTDLDLSPVVVITTIVIWTALIGPMGALLAVPLTISLRAVLAPFPGARWFL